MDMHFTELIDPLVSKPIESELNFFLCDLSTGRLASFLGKLTGPYCKFARTLPTTWQIPECKCLPEVSNGTQKRIIDPCYWTPSLPYLYDFQIEMICSDGTSQTSSHSIGFRRWGVEGHNFRLERKRTVLRGVCLEDESNIDLTEAHSSEVAVMVSSPSEAFLQEASECGVMIVADIRNSKKPLTTNLLSFSWQPCVALVIPAIDACYVPHSQILTQYISSANNLSLDELNEDWNKAVIVELAPNERPPTWLASVERPTIAIRRGVNFSTFQEARAACDRLQAELAPEFDLAGYFVAP